MIRSPAEQPILISVLNPPDLTDIDGHFAERAIRQTIGLELFSWPQPDGRFRPDEAFNRRDYALVIDHVLGLFTLQPSKTGLVGSSAAYFFTDLAASNFAYPAAATAISHGFLNLNQQGQFQPLAPVSGAEILIGLRRLTDLIQPAPTTSDNSLTGGQ